MTKGLFHLQISNSSLISPFSGLTLLLNISQNEYIETMTKEAGIRAYVGNQGHLSAPNQEGFSLAPGFSYYVALRKVISGVIF